MTVSGLHFGPFLIDQLGGLYIRLEQQLREEQDLLKDIIVTAVITTAQRPGGKRRDKFLCASAVIYLGKEYEQASETVRICHRIQRMMAGNILSPSNGQSRKITLGPWELWVTGGGHVTVPYQLKSAAVPVVAMFIIRNLEPPDIKRLLDDGCHWNFHQMPTFQVISLHIWGARPGIAQLAGTTVENIIPTLAIAIAGTPDQIEVDLFQQSLRKLVDKPAVEVKRIDKIGEGNNGISRVEEHHQPIQMRAGTRRNDQDTRGGRESREAGRGRGTTGRSGQIAPNPWTTAKERARKTHEIDSYNQQFPIGSTLIAKEDKDSNSARLEEMQVQITRRDEIMMERLMGLEHRYKVDREEMEGRMEHRLSSMERNQNESQQEMRELVGTILARLPPRPGNDH
jgi:hypothetical protein